MEKKSNSLKELIPGFIALGVVALIVVIAFRFIMDSISSAVTKIVQVTSNVDAVIIVALITGAVSIVGVILSSIIAKILEYRQNIKRYLYEKREEPYSDFIEMVYKLQQKSKNNTSYTDEEMTNDIIKFSKKLTLWGSSRVIRKWLKFRETSQTNVDGSQSNPTSNLFILEDIIFEIRKDMGQAKRGLKQGDLLAFFINDIRHYVTDRR